MAPNRRRVVRAYYLFQFFFTLLFWAPIFFEFQKRLGMSEPEIFRIQSIYYVVFCLFEIPTGYFADRFGYRNSIKLGAVLLVVSNLIAVYADVFVGGAFAAMVVHWVLIAAARSFVSGASTAYLYEFLRRSGLETAAFKQIEGNARAYSLLGRVLCFAVIGYLMEWKVTLPYWLTVASATTAVGFAWWLPRWAPQTPLPVSNARPESLDSAAGAVLTVSPNPVPSSPLRPRAPLGSVFLQAVRSRWLMLLMFQGVVLFVLARVISVNLFQPILEGKAFGVGAYGLVMAGMTLVEALGAARPDWMRRWVKGAYVDLNSVGILSAVMALSIVVIPFFAQVGTLVVLAIFSLMVGLSYPIQRQVMNDAIPDPDFRATLLSLESLIDRAVTAAVAASLEVLSHRLDAFLVGCGIASIALVVLIQTLIHRELRRRAAFGT